MSAQPDPHLYLLLDRQQLTPSVIRQLANILHHDVSIALDQQSIWLKIRLVAKNQRWIDQLPGERFRSELFGLRRWNQNVVSVPSPECQWYPLRDTIELLLPFASVGDGEESTTSLEFLPPEQVRLCRGGEPRDPAAIVITMATFAEWVEAARDASLEGMEYVCSEGEVLVRGKRLPPIAGEYWMEHSRILIPAGYEWVPRIDASLVRKLLKVKEDDWIWWAFGQRPQFFDNDCWCRVTRRSIRAELAKMGVRE